MSTLPVPLRIAPSDDQPQADEAEAPAEHEPAAARLAVLQGGQMGVTDQAREAVWHAFRVARLQVREMQRREGGLVNGLMNGKPPSVQEQCDYAKSRAWVPRGHDGGIAEKSGVIYHALIGRPGVAFGNWISATSARPLRLILTALILSVIVVITWIFIF